MGDGADQALERAAEEVNHFQKYQDSDLATQYDEGLIDESGSTIGNPRSFPGISNNTIPDFLGDF